ncbi:hypothetical protein N8035_02455 [Algibacter sp.]|nr:hypothetical protein [Algibacter sp.]
MAQEIKNTFLKSKMNKDLDDRILPNGEYRDARNISVGRSEDNDVGALENIIGNNLVTGTDIGNGLTIIGIEADNSTDRLFVFLTDYEDPDVANPTNAPSTSKHYIYSYNNSTGSYKRLVQGEFLNFSTTNRIVGINLLENLLFWTDNRNQPRKINVNLAEAFDPTQISTGVDYYTQEHQISVAKYNPYPVIQLYNRADLQVISGASATSFQVAGDRSVELSAYIGATVVCSESTPPTQGADYVTVTSVLAIGTSGPTTITVSPAMAIAPTAGQYVSLISSTMSNKSDDDTWPGDPDFLEDKFVRFSYRFKFDDNEYSLMAPFTQIAYIPKQKGFFINGDEDAAYQSTIVGFMENLVQNVNLVIPLPTLGNKIVSDYKIKDLEILFRESDALAVKVLTTITAGTIAGDSGLSNYYTYEYQSRKAYRTLPEAQTVRVFDKVPVRALSQEVAGNRIIYGNYRDQHTPPKTINYNCRVEPKSSTGAFNNWVEYPNHSVKRNRNYQVGFVLADKFGRQSPVILSSADAGATKDNLFYSGSTIYAPYDLNSTDTNVLSWMGDAIQVLVNQPISSTMDLATGTPGLYALKQQATSTGEGFAITDAFAAGGESPITNTTWTFTADTTYPNNQNIPQQNDYLRGAYEDFVKVKTVVNTVGSTYLVTTSGKVNDLYLRENDLPPSQPDLKFAYTINDLGWYSYKIVVKQTEQDYYNVYLPGILNGYPGQSKAGNEAGGDFPANEVGLTAHTVLFNDNINKVPRDLKEVGEQDKQFRSSVVLYGRVSNTMLSTSDASNYQYYPRLSSTGKNAIDHTAIAIATADEFDMSFQELSESGGTTVGGDFGNKVFYQIDTNPLIARISTTEKSIGQSNITTGTGLPYNMLPYLAIYETAPFESNLDLYWETSSEGLIVDLNAAIASSNTGVTGFQGLTWDFKEDIATNTAVTTAWFSPIDNQGLPFTNLVTASLISATNGNGNEVGFFELESGAVGGANEGEFKIIYSGSGIVFTQGSNIIDVYSFVIRCTTSEGITTDVVLQGEPEGFGALQNITPSFDAISNIVKSQSDRVLMAPALWDSAVNGTWLTGTPAKQQLIYSFSGTSGEQLPANWAMDPNSGKLTQFVPGESISTAGENIFEGNPIGTYNVTIKLTDVNAESPANTSNPYTSFSASQDITIRLAYPAVNPEALWNNTCIITPTSPGNNNVSNGVLRTNVPTNNGTSTSVIYYITETTPATGDEPAFFFGNGIQPATDTDNLYYYKIGTGGHYKGSIAFTVNFYMPFNVPGQGASARVPRTYFYYREEGTSEWLKLPRSMEDNRVGYNNFMTFPTYDAPSLELTDGYVFNYGPDPVWAQGIRSVSLGSSANALGTETPPKIEYAIFVEGLRQTGGATNNSNTAMVWLGVDDLHYPTCVPWQGTNAVEANGGNPGVTYPYYKYFRSTGGGNSTNYTDLSSSTDYVWAETPYGDYVNQFYTSQTGYVPFKPAAGSNYINFKIDRAMPVSTLLPWTNKPLPGNPPPASTPVNLQWVAGYDETSGDKIVNSSITSGVSAIQTTNEQNFSPGRGTLRISKN